MVVRHACASCLCVLRTSLCLTHVPYTIIVTCMYHKSLLKLVCCHALYVNALYVNELRSLTTIITHNFYNIKRNHLRLSFSVCMSILVTTSIKPQSYQSSVRQTARRRSRWRESPVTWTLSYLHLDSWRHLNWALDDYLDYDNNFLLITIQCCCYLITFLIMVWLLCHIIVT